MLYLVGLGLHDEGDLSIKGLEALKKADRIYAESYTSFYNGNLSVIEQWIDKKIILLDRTDIEEKISSNLLSNSKDEDIALLVCGDPLIATTHADIILQAQNKDIKFKVIHSSCIYSAVAETGLHIYKFGKTTTLPYPEKNYLPCSPYDVIRQNQDMRLHSLVLLDVKADEKRYMSVNEGIEVLLRMEDDRKKGLVDDDLFIVAAARLGGDSIIKAGSLRQLMTLNYGGPPHCIIIPAQLHYTEKQMLKLYSAGD